MASAITSFLAAPLSVKNARAHTGPRQPSPLTLRTVVRQPSNRSRVTVMAAGDVSADSQNYLIAGAAAIALLGTAIPVLFLRKDTCPECDGRGYIQKGKLTQANFARKDAQVVCPRCKGLGKLNQVDK